MESLCAETSGVLVVLRFLVQYTKYHHITLSEHIPLHYCDNSTLCRRMKAVHKEYTTTTTTTQSLQPDWDVQLAIEEKLQELNTTIETNHVYGHQDTRDRLKSMEDKSKETHDIGKQKNKDQEEETETNMGSIPQHQSR
eukprot:9243100-Ditylum_brightwellii.AAC.1